MDFQLTKEEIKISAGRGFYIPIHPRLLDSNISFDPTLANQVFQRVAVEWHEELTKYLATTRLDHETLWYLEFVKDRPFKVIRDEDSKQSLSNPCGWKDEVLTDERGFAYHLMIERNFGGSLGFRAGATGCETYIRLDGKEGRYFHISRQKALELAFERDEELGKIHTYAPHNITHFPGALFMRNWAISYVNEAMKSL